MHSAAGNMVYNRSVIYLVLHSAAGNMVYNTSVIYLVYSPPCDIPGFSTMWYT